MSTTSEEDGTEDEFIVALHSQRVHHCHSQIILLLPKLSQVSSTSGEDGAEDEGEENPGPGIKQTSQQQ